jgi:hypothetical protein
LALSLAWILAWLDESAFVGEDVGLGAVVHVEFLEHAGDVGLDGGLAEDEVAGDVAVGLAAGEEAEDVELARGEPGERDRLFAGGRAMGHSPRSAVG